MHTITGACSYMSTTVTWLKKIFKFTCLKWLKAIVGENNESQVGKNHKLYTMVGENLAIYLSQMAKNHLKLCTMVGENIEIYWSQIGQYHLNSHLCSTDDLEYYAGERLFYY